MSTSAEPDSKKRKIEEITATENSENVATENTENVAAVSTVETNGKSFSISDSEKAKVASILSVLPQNKKQDLLMKICEQLPGALQLLIETASSEVSCKKLFVRGISSETSKDALSAYFSQFGELAECSIVMDKTTGVSKGYAFITYCSVNDTFNAINQEGSLTLDGRDIHVKLADEGQPQHQAPGVTQQPTYTNSSAASSYTAPSASYGSNYNNSASKPAATGGFGRQPDSDDVKARKLFVRGINWYTTKETIQAVYSQFGRVESVYLAMDHASGKSKGYAFITMVTDAEAQNALRTPTIELEGRRVTCSLACMGNPTRGSGGGGAAASNPNTMAYNSYAQQYGGYGAAAGTSGYGAAAGTSGYGAATSGYGAQQYGAAGAGAYGYGSYGAGYDASAYAAAGYAGATTGAASGYGAPGATNNGQ